MIDYVSAANAYRNQLKLMQEAANTPVTTEDPAQPSFQQLMETAVKEAVSTQYQAEAVQMESLTGKVELADLVTAVANAELSLNTVVAVRDRVISAYQDILRMPI